MLKVPVLTCLFLQHRLMCSNIHRTNRHLAGILTSLMFDVIYATHVSNRHKFLPFIKSAFVRCVSGTERESVGNKLQIMQPS